MRVIIQYLCIKFCVFLLMFPVFFAHAQGRISGTVRQPSGVGLGGVKIYTSKGRLLATTDGKGFYQTNTLPSASHKLIFFSFEYKSAEKVVNISDSDVTLNLSLSFLGAELPEVVVLRQREKLFALEQLKAVEGTAIYAGKKTEVIFPDALLGNKATNNARQIYAQIAGLNIYENDDAGLQLNIGGRGLDPNRSANFNTRQNGYDISADVLGYPESYYTPPPDALESVQVIRGAASLQYGTQFGGLVNFKFKMPPKDKKISFLSRQSLGSFGLFNSFNSLSGTLGRVGYYTYFNYKKGDGFRPNSHFKAVNLYAHLAYALATHTTLVLEGTHLKYLAKQAGGLTDQKFLEDPTFSNRTRNWFAVDWNLWAVKFSHHFTKKTRLSVRLFGLAAQRKALGFRGTPLSVNPVTAADEPKFGVYPARDLIVGTFQNWGSEIRFLSEYNIGGRAQIFLVGAKYYDAHNGGRQGPGTNGFDANFNFANDAFPTYANQSSFIFPNRNLAVFGEHIFSLSERFSLTPGIRFEYIKTESEGSYQQVLRDGAGNPLPGGIRQIADQRRKPRTFVLTGLGASYKPSRYFECYANASQNYRSVTFSDLHTVNPSFLVDENITDEKGGTTDAGIRGRWKEQIAYDLSGFALFYQKRIGVILESKGPHKGDRLRTNVGDAFIYGLETMLNWDLSNTFSEAMGETLLQCYLNLALTSSRYTKSIENGVEGKRVEFIPGINLKTGVKFGYKNFLSSLQYTHLSAQYTDASNAEIADNAFSPQAGIVGPIPAYSVLDLSFSYRYKRWKIETGINNLLNEKYFTRRATGYPGPGIIPSASRNAYLTLQFEW